MFYNRCTHQLIGFGGGAVENNNMQIIADTGLSSSVAKNFNGSTTAFNDIADVKMDYNGDFYAFISSWAMFNNVFRNRLQKSLSASSYNPPAIWDVVSGYDYSEEGNTGLLNLSYPTGPLFSVRANMLSLNSSFLYSYDGRTIKAWNKTNGSVIDTIDVSAGYTAGLARNHEE